ncbi:MAG: transcription-repair coupling factor, partial [Bacteroidota bacterium]|nr:transcription-repair coupling factor [Bacteroidota bacterium]
MPFFIQSLYFTQKRSCIIVASDKEKAAYLLNDLETLLANEKILFFPESYRQPYQEEKTTNANIQERAEVLNLLSKDTFTGIVITYPQALAEKVTLKQKLHQNTLQIKKGEKLSIDFISEFLVSYDFEQVDFVYEPGQFSIRGGIIDIFSFANEFPYRIELFGNEVDAIRTFDPTDQLSNAKFDFVTIIPNINSTIFTEEKVVLFNYFDPSNSFLFLEDADYALDIFDRKFESATKAFHQHAGEIKQVPPEKLYARSDELKEQLKKFTCFEFGIRSVLSSENIKFNQRPQPSFNKNFDLLIANLKENKSKGYDNFFLTDNVKQADRLISIFNDLLAKEHRTYDTLIDYLQLDIHEGFIDEDLKIAIYTDHQIF